MGKIDLTHQEKIFRDQIGQKATIQREDVQNEASGRANAKLADLGQELNPLPDTDLKYCGSAAVHIFHHEGLGQVFFISQTNGLVVHKCPEILAAKAFDDLLREFKQTYGKRHSRLRSGF